MDGISKAYNLAQTLHQGQTRLNGDPYFTHCVAVYKILKEEWNINNSNYLIAGLLHDVVEDTTISLGEIKNMFGSKVASLVDGVTKISHKTDKDTLIKVIKKTYLNPGVAIIKLADRLHNMRDNTNVSAQKMLFKSHETLDVYCRLAESLGMWQVKTELEDICFKHINPKEFNSIKKTLSRDPRVSKKFTDSLSKKIKEILDNNNFNYQLEIRKNGLWSIAQKQKKLALKGKCNSKTFSQISDFISFRVILSSTIDCYCFLGILHREMDNYVDYNSLDEYMGSNKQVNGYQAIQTTLNFPEGSVEVALVTKNIENFNNWGVIDLLKNNQKKLNQYTLKLVFTSTGSTRFLSKNATGIDFAALVNPRLLAEADKIRIDGKIFPLTTVLPNASTVSFILGKPRRAPLAGIEHYCLPQTKRLILSQRIQENKDFMIEKGKEIMSSILKKRGIVNFRDLGKKITNPIIYYFGAQNYDELYFMIATGSLSKKELNKILDDSGITKQGLSFTTIHITGKDKPKILLEILKIIGDMNKNIVHINQEKTESDYFDVRIIIKNLSKQEELVLKNYLKNNSSFEKKILA
jgi:GTP diphosphokinase / guanosine-3',5'-bis(diphosphate) 3'-diphosphatase